MSFLSVLRRPSIWHLPVTVVCLLALGLQSFIAQAHIHSPAEFAAEADRGDAHNAAAQSSTQQRGDASQPQKSTPHHHLAACRLCQSAGYGGALLAYVYAALSLPIPHRVPVSLAVRTVFLNASVSHSWQSRGPPR